MLGLTGVEGLSCKNPDGADINIYNNVLHISFGSPLMKDAAYVVFDLSGRKCASGILPQGKAEWDVVLDVPRGVYAVQLNVDGKGRSGSVLVRVK